MNIKLGARTTYTVSIEMSEDERLHFTSEIDYLLDFANQQRGKMLGLNHVPELYNKMMEPDFEDEA